MIVTLYRPAPDGSIDYYTMHDRQPALDARYSLSVNWRRDRAKEREKVFYFDRLEDFDKKLKSVFDRKIKQGYRLLYSFTRDSERGLPLPTTSGAKRGLG